MNIRSRLGVYALMALEAGLYAEPVREPLNASIRRIKDSYDKKLKKSKNNEEFKSLIKERDELISNLRNRR